MDDHFEKVLEEIDAIHVSKRSDYGTNEDDWANVRVSEGYGIPAWVHASALVDHKSQRIRSFVTKGRLEHEGVRDSLLDRATYAVAALVLYDEAVSRDSHSTPVLEMAPGASERLEMG